MWAIFPSRVCDCGRVIIIIIIIIIITAIELSPGGSSPYTSTDKTNKNKIYINETIQNTVNTGTAVTTNFLCVFSVL